MKLLVSREFAERFGAAARELGRPAGVDLELVTPPKDPDERIDAESCEALEAAYFDTGLYPRYSAAFFSAVFKAPRLRWMQVMGAGLDHPVFAQLRERGVVLTNTPGASARPIAQSALAGLLMLARRFPFYLAHQRERRWERYPDPPPPDLEHQTLVVVGLGGIGTELARLAQALGLRVIGVRRSPARGDEPVDELHPPRALAKLWPRADWLALTCPLTDETRGLVDARALDALPGGAHVINVGRGELIDEPALIERLRSGRIAGAYLDVFATEPLPADSPFWSLPNVIVTPHGSAISAGFFERTARRFLANLDHFLNDRPLEDVFR